MNLQTLFLLIFALLLLTSGRFIFNPAVLGVLIPIIAIIAFSPIGKALADLIKDMGKKPDRSENTLDNWVEKHKSLESKLLEAESEIAKLRESVIFYENKSLNPTSKTEKKSNEKTNENNGIINLVKEDETNEDEK